MIAYIIMGIIGVLCIIGFVLMMIGIFQSPIGWEDDKGFHVGKEPTDSIDK